MDSEAAIARATLLIAQHHYPRAQELLQQALAADPDNARAHAWLAHCLLQNKDLLRDATRAAERGVFLAPEDPFTHFILASVWETRNEINKALESINEAIALDPANAGSFALRTQLFLKKSDWSAALASAEEGLARDPEDDTLQGLRVIALERLGRLGDARAQAELARQQAPESSVAHTSLGYALLKEGNYRQAKESFAEALRLAPANELARTGMIKALNSSNFLYRWMFLLMSKVSRLSGQYQWALIIGLWLGVQFLQRIAADRPWLQTWVMPISMFYLLLVMMTWIMEPLFNTMLRFHPFGKYLLSNKEKWASNLIAMTLAISLLLAIVMVVMAGAWVVAVIPLLMGLYLMIPFVVPFKCEVPWTIVVSTLVAIGFAGMYLVFNIGLLFDQLFMSILPLFMFGIVVYCFASQVLMRMEKKF